ncbi:putative ATP-dependent RNA helicase TDRD12 isoform X2 [Clinocottus analis]|uniref:putative ATP-dependent RNA helicase TDRD12 isoform X2 n=1 Tax=Clinocottus analis TaxID=304258 RepID=UPI0035BF44ED
MLKISILKVESPSCLWGRVVRGPGGDAETTDQYDRLLAQMNLFYHDLTRDLRELKPTLLEEGQVCVVYWSAIKSWCRAVVESVIVDSVSCQARCFLVDQGERLVVPSDKIRIAVPSFLKLPFGMRRFHLVGIEPMTLRVSFYEEKPRLMPSTRWDSSATLYLHNLLQASTQTEAVLLDSESDSTAIELYLTMGNVKICVKDDLVAKKFAYYSGCLDEVDQIPVMLTSSILTQGVCSTSNKPTAQTTQPPPGGDSSGCMEAYISDYQVIDRSRPAVASVVTEEQNGSDAAAAENDSSEETDSSLAAALSKSLSLFRFMKFLNPGSSSEQADPTMGRHEELLDHRPEETPAASSSDSEQEVYAASRPSAAELENENEYKLRTSGAESVSESGLAERLVEQESSSSSPSVDSGPAEKTRRTKEDWACSRLLEWLNPTMDPEPLNPDAADAAVGLNTPPSELPQCILCYLPVSCVLLDCPQAAPNDPSRSGVLVHSALPVEPCTGLDDAPVTDALRWVLRKKQYGALSAADRYGWPSVSRGCDTLIVSHGAAQPLSYLAPLLTHILLNSIFASHSSNAGPVAVLLCPGWEKAQVVYDLLEETRAASPLHPAIVLLGVGKDEAKAVRIPKNCLLLVTTPFSLVRLLSCHCFLFLRLFHLVLDEADRLFALAPDQMDTILQHFQKVTSSEENASCPQQLVAVAKRWTSRMEGLVANHMSCPCIVIAVPEEAALYGNVQQIILMTLESSKFPVMLGALDFNPDVGQKTLIVANSAAEVEDVFKAVSNKSAFCLKTHEGLTHQFDFVMQQWRKDIGPGTHVILVTSSECLKCLGVRDASCVVHHGFPSSPKQFGVRLSCLADGFRNLAHRVSPEDPAGRRPRPSRSVLLISERNASHVVGVLRYLERTDAPLPPELLSFARGVHEAREDHKTTRPLCSYLKSFGVCRDGGVCPDRHRFLPQLDRSVLPASGVIEVLPLYVKTASVFCGRLVQKEDGGFRGMAAEMEAHYANGKLGAGEVLQGGLYAVQEDEGFHRVKVLSVPDRGDRLFFSASVRFIDVGKEAEVKSHQILQLPERFHALPGQAVEIVVCRVRPVDGETDWHPKVTRAINQRIRGLQHRARAVFSLDNTVFVDPMVRLTQLPGMKTVINEYSVQSEILNTGMGVSNQQHLDLLRSLCREHEAGGRQEAGHASESPDGPASLEVRIKAEVEVLTDAVRAAEVGWLADLPLLEPCEPLGPVTPPAARLHPVPACGQNPLQPRAHRNAHTADPESAEPLTRIGDEGGVLPAAHLDPEGKGDDRSNSRHNETDCDESTKSFHPLVRWYQTPDSVVVTVKLRNPESQRCDFYADRVVYSGRVAGRTYRADLLLHGNVAADRCCWEMKSNEPVLQLVKQQPGDWVRLLRNKSIFVSYDTEHIEEDEDEDRTPNGLHFVEDPGMDNSYVISESDSD